jgi:hypothetical protein
MSGIVPGSCNIRISSYLLFIENLGPAGVDPRARRQPSALHQPKCGGPELRDRQHYTAEPKWYSEEIDIAFQFDGNYKQQAYSVCWMG